MPNRACEEVYILAKIQLLFDFTPLALYKTIFIHFFHKVILGQLYACTISFIASTRSVQTCVNVANIFQTLYSSPADSMSSQSCFLM